MQINSQLTVTSGKNWGYRLGTAIFLAIVLTAAILFIPIAVSSSVELTVPGLPAEYSLNVPLPLQAQPVRAANGLTITKSATPATFVDQGGFITYTLTLTNESGTDLGNLVIFDTVPLNSSCALTAGGQIFDGIDASSGFWAASQSSCSNGTARWQYSFLLNPGGYFTDGETVALSYRVAVNEPLRDRIDEVVNEAGYTVLSEVYSDTGIITVTHLINAPLWKITKVATPTTVEPGNPITFTITVTNSGHLQTGGTYTLTEVLPTYTNYVSGTGTPPDNFDGASLTWAYTTPLAINDAFTVTYALTVTTPLTNNTKIVNQTYHITGGNVFSQAFGTPVTVTVDTPVTMTISKSDDPYDPVPAGDLLTYTITITNDNSSKGAAEGLIFTDTIPADTVFDNAGFVGATTGSTGTNGSVVTWTVSSPAFIAIGNAVQLTLTVRVQSPLANNSVITNSDYGLVVSNTINPILPQPVTTTVQSAPIITLTKAVTPQVVIANQQITYTIFVTNTGNETAINIPLTDTIEPASGFTPISATWAITVPGRDLAGNAGAISRTFVVTSDIPTGNFPNFVTTTVAGNISIGPVATVTVRAPVDLQISKIRQGSDAVVAGTPVTYTITVTNAPGSDTVDVVITDTFTNAAYLSDSHADCSNSGSRLICNFSSFTNTQVITLALNTSASVSGTITNTAVITTALPGLIDANPGDNRVDPPVTTPVRYPIADLQISKIRLGPDDVTTGTPITYTLTLTNAGPDSVDVVVTDTFTNATYLNDSDADCSNSGSQLICNLSGFTNTQVITLVLNTSASAFGAITNTAQITFSPAITAVEPNPGNNLTPPVTTTVRFPTTDLQIGKARLGSGPLIAGDAITYTITITNAGPDTVDAVVTDTFTNATYLSDSDGACSNSGSRLLCSISNFTNTRIITLVLNTSASVSGTLTNTAFITSTSPNLVESNPGNNQVNPPVTATVRYPTANLQVSKVRLGPDEVTTGTPITYTVTLTNAGPQAVDAVLTDTFVNATFLAVFTATGSGAACSSTPSGPLNCTISNLTNTQVITLVLNTSASAFGAITNTAQITFSPAITAVDPNPGNNLSLPVTTTVRFPTTDLQLGKARLGSGAVVAGNAITYTLTLTNAGPDTVDAVVTDTFPGAAATSVISASSPAALCSNTAGQVVCSFTTFTNSATITLTLNSAATYSGTLANTAKISPTSPNAIESNPTDNQDTVSATVRFPTADFQISKTRLGSGVVVAGNAITYTLTLTNAGPDTLDAVVTDTFTGAAVTSVISASSPAALCSSAAGQVFCNFSAFTNTATLTLTLNTSPTFTGALANTAEISPTSPNAIESNPADNQDAVTTTVRLPAADLQLDKAGPAGALAGATITYTLTLTNAGPDTVDAVITDTFDNGTLNTATAGRGLCSEPTPGTVVCTVTALTNTELITIAIDTPTTIAVISNQAEITVTTSNAVDPDTGNNTDSLTTGVFLRNADLQISKALAGSGSVTAGGQITFTLTVTNAGPDPVGATLGDIVSPAVAANGIAFAAPGWLCSGVTAFSGQCSTTNFALGAETITVVLTTSTTYAGLLQNSVNINVGPGAVEVDSSNNFDFVTANVTAAGTSPVLTITKTAAPAAGNVLPGDTIVYSVAVENTGTAAATGVVITDSLPGGVGFVGGSDSSNGSFSETGGQVTVTGGTLGIGQFLTATWQVTVTATSSGTTLSNSADADSDTTGQITSQIVSHQVITVATNPSIIYLPLILKNCCLPNLVIDSFTVDSSTTNPPTVTVVIRNNGQASTGSGFWVDAYVDPTTKPKDLVSGSNPGDRRWQRVSSQGIAWPIAAPLAAGDSITVTSTGGFVPTQTNWTALSPGAHQIYTFIDSFDAGDNWYVEIFESDETDNQGGPNSVIIVSGVEINAAERLAPPNLSATRQDLDR